LSAFVDIAIVLAVLGAARSGWRRGLVFYVVDLLGFVGSVIVAVRFHEIPGVFFEVIGLSTRTANVVGGLVIFVPLIVLVAIVGMRASKAMYRPGLFTTNRVLGAVFGALLVVSVIVVGLLFARSWRLPFGISDLVSRSAIAPAVLDAVAPGVAWVDDTLGLDLCGGRLARTVPELCADKAGSG
jgi:uncharacterized membrane protein required for colicin V production